MSPDELLFPRTKFQSPRVREDIIPRLELAAQLSDSLRSSRLSLLSAPAGYGKTSALAEVDQRQAGPPIAWLRLDDSDDDPARFFAALVGAVHQLHAQIGARSNSLLNSLPDPGAEPERLGTVFINEVLDADPKPFALVLDDLHLVRAGRALQILAYLLVHMPPQMRLAIATRRDPPLRLASMRAKGQLSEFRLPAFKFSLHESSLFLNDRLGLGLNEEEMELLHARLEGWPAGLRLLASSLEGSLGRAKRQELIRRLGRRDHHLADFLKVEVLERQEPEIRTFLLESSILTELTSIRCRKVTGRADAPGLLKSVWDRNLFLTQRDGEHQSFRYHPVFRGFLQERLRTHRPDREIELHMRAAKALRLIDPSEAVRHLLAAQRWGAAMDLIEREGERFLNRGWVETVVGWLQVIPPNRRKQRPRLTLLMGLCHFHRADLDKAEGQFRAALDGLEQLGEEAAVGKALTHMASIAWTQTELGRTDALIGRALRYALPPVEEMRLYLIGAALGLYQGDESRAQGDLAKAFDLAERVDRPDVCRQLLGWVTPGVVCFPGNLDRAERLCARVRGLSDGQVGVLSMANQVASTLVHLYRGQMEEARRAAERALELESRLGGGPSLVWKSNLYSALAMIHRGRRRYGAAARAAEAAIQEYGALVPERALISLQYQKGYIHWLRGEIHDLRQLYAHMKESKYVGPGMNAPLKLLEGLVELSADHRRPAERALRKAVSDGQKVHMAYPFGSPRLQLAHAYWKWDRPEEALAQFTPLLRKCAQRRMAGRILMEAEPALPLLELCVETGVEREFSEELLGKLSAAGTPQAVWVPETDEALTPRQLEVLDLLATGATNKEIAEALVISVHTVKRHVSDILSRMNVSTRTEAAARARELGML